MKNLFYMLAILPVVWEWIKIIYPVRVHLFLNPVQKKRIWLYKIYFILAIGYALWLLWGCFTPNILYSLCILFLGFKTDKQTTDIIRLDGIVKFAILLFIILNEYWFHTDIVHWIENF